MKGILTVMGFTFRERARKKSFIISTAILLILSIAAICVPAIINSFKSTSNPATQSGTNGTVFVIDSQNIISSYTTELAKAFPGYNFVQKQAADKQNLIDEVKNSDNYDLMVLTLKSGTPYFDYYAKKEGNGPDTQQLSLAVKAIYDNTLLKQNDVSPQLMSKLNANVAYNYNTIGRGTAGGMIASCIVVILLFFAIYMYGIWVAMSIASEKTSRVMEILITSTKPSKIVIGKSIGMGLLGLSQLIGVIAVDALSLLCHLP